MKEQSKTPEKVLSDKEIANLSNGEFKTLVIKMLTELIEHGHNMKEQTKATQSEIKQNFRKPTVTGREPDSKQQFGAKGRNKHPTGTE